VNFTREPIIETVITPKEGCKLVVRNSKAAGQEEYFVDAAEVVSFGTSFFFRSLERPKSFLVPVTDYEVIEVRETRMVLKHAGAGQTIKIGGGRETKQSRDKDTSARKDKSSEAIAKPPTFSEESSSEKTSVEKIPTEKTSVEKTSAEEGENKLEKRRDKRRSRRRRDREDKKRTVKEEVLKEEAAKGDEDGDTPVDLPPPVVTSLLPPPKTLISETIGRYKEQFNLNGDGGKDSKDSKEENITQVEEEILHEVAGEGFTEQNVNEEETAVLSEGEEEKDKGRSFWIFPFSSGKKEETTETVVEEEPASPAEDVVEDAPIQQEEVVEPAPPAEDVIEDAPIQQEEVVEPAAEEAPEIVVEDVQQEEERSSDE
jgi:hypothetical protein